MIFYYGLEPVLIQRILIGFKAILGEKIKGSWKENEVAGFVVFSQ